MSKYALPNISTSDMTLEEQKTLLRKQLQAEKEIAAMNAAAVAFSQWIARHNQGETFGIDAAAGFLRKFKAALLD